MSILKEVADRLERKKFGFGVICNAAGTELQNKAKNNASWTDRSSHARQGIKSTVSGGGLNSKINISHSVDYGGILEEGSAPHIITVKNKKVLSNGSDIFGRVVNHPGTKPYNGIKSTVKTEVGPLGDKLAKYWSR